MCDEQLGFKKSSVLAARLNSSEVLADNRYEDQLIPRYKKKIKVI